MASDPLLASSAIQPLAALATEPGVLAVITGVEGPSYRPVGATMALLSEGRRVGSLSSGCIEGDIALHAQEALKTGEVRQLRYGKDSEFRDISLPCGGGLDILLFPKPDRSVLGSCVARHERRTPFALRLEPGSSNLSIGPREAMGWKGDHFFLTLDPEIMFYVFGKGPEAAGFAALARSTGFPCCVLSPDEETLDAARSCGAQTRHLVSAKMPRDIRPDARSAIVLFFHDHEWEPPILKDALASPAFYIGAQGSRNARLVRNGELSALGLSGGEIARLHGPIGLIPSSRDARTLAVSVLAEILAKAHQGAA